MADPTRFFQAAVAGLQTPRSPVSPDVGERLEERADDVVVGSRPSPPGRIGRLDETARGHVQRVEADIRRRGWETVAFYAPYHRYGADEYGIYFCLDTFAALVVIVASHLRQRGAFDSLWDGTYAAILAHEEFHFAVELAATHAEVVTGSRELYATRAARYGGSGQLSAVGLREEALATADEIRRARRLSPNLASVLAQLSKGLPGYGAFQQYVGTNARRDGQLAIMRDLLGTASTGELLERQVAAPYVGGLPVRWLIPKSLPPWLHDLLGRTFPLPIAKVLAHARRHGAIVEQRTRHLAVTVKGKPRPVTISSGWGKEIPRQFVRSFAALFDLSPGEYSRQVLLEL